MEDRRLLRADTIEEHEGEVQQEEGEEVTEPVGTAVGMEDSKKYKEDALKKVFFSIDTKDTKGAKDKKEEQKEPVQEEDSDEEIRKKLEKVGSQMDNMDKKLDKMSSAALSPVLRVNSEPSSPSTSKMSKKAMFDDDSSGEDKEDGDAIIEMKDVEAEKDKEKEAQNEDEEYFITPKEGMHGGWLFAYKYVISNKSIKSVVTSGGAAWIVSSILSCIVLGFFGVMIEASLIGRDLDYYLWVIFGLFGLISGCYVGFICSVKKHYDTMETKMVTDVELSQTWIQRRFWASAGTIHIYSLDPTTPYLEARVMQDAELIYKGLLKCIDRIRGEINPEDEEQVFPTQTLGDQIPDFLQFPCFSFFGCWGCWPYKEYRFTTRNIHTTHRNAFRIVQSNIRLERVYDLEMSVGAIGHYGPRFFPCCAPICPLYRMGIITLYSFDRNGCVYVMKVRDAPTVFDAIREKVDAKGATDLHFLELKAQGLLAERHLQSMV